MNRDDRQVVRKAASLLRAEAKVIRDSCKGAENQLFVCGNCDRTRGKCDAQRQHDAMVKTATKLLAMAKPA